MIINSPDLLEGIVANVAEATQTVQITESFGDLVLESRTVQMMTFTPMLLDDGTVELSVEDGSGRENVLTAITAYLESA